MPRSAAFQLDRSVTHRLHTLGKLTDRVTQQAYLADAGMALGEGRCLSAVASFGPLSVNDLAGLANLNKGQASRAAQALVDQGLVLKVASQTDGRGVLLSLTPDGHAAWLRAMQVVERRNHEIFGLLNVAEEAQLSAIFDRLLLQARASCADADSSACSHGDE